MSAGRMPTEIEALASHFAGVASELSSGIADMPSLFAAATDWMPSTEQMQAMDRPTWALLSKARALEFALAQLTARAAVQAQQDRLLFDKTLALVDVCRFGRAVPAHGAAPAPGAVALADAVEDGLADMQNLLRARFAGQAFPEA